MRRGILCQIFCVGLLVGSSLQALSRLQHDGYARIQILYATPSHVVCLTEVSGTEEQSLFVVRADTQGVAWRLAETGRVALADGSGEGTVNLVIGHRLVTFDLATGAAKWELDLRHLPWSAPRRGQVPQRIDWLRAKLQQPDLPEAEKTQLTEQAEGLEDYIWRTLRLTVPRNAADGILICRDAPQADGLDQTSFCDWVVYDRQAGKVVASGDGFCVGRTTTAALLAGAGTHLALWQDGKVTDLSPQLARLVPGGRWSSWDHALGVATDTTPGPSCVVRQELGRNAERQDVFLLFDERTRELQAVTPHAEKKQGLQWEAAGPNLFCHAQCDGEMPLAVFDVGGRRLAERAIPAVREHQHLACRGLTPKGDAVFTAYHPPPGGEWPDPTSARLRLLVLGVPGLEVKVDKPLTSTTTAWDVVFGVPAAELLYVAFGNRDAIVTMAVDEQPHEFVISCFAVYSGQERWHYRERVTVKKVRR